MAAVRYLHPMNNLELDRRFLLGGLAGAAGISALAAMAKGGPLNPPAGGVASSGKTLTEVEPRVALSAANTPGGGGNVFNITQPGSYYLTGNVAVPAGGVGIYVALAAGVAENAQVTIDLMGFEIAGGTVGIFATNLAATKTLAIRNGRIRGTSSSGILANSSSVSVRVNCVIEDIWVTGAGGNGMVVGGGVVRGCVVEGAGLTGIAMDGPALIESSIVMGATNGAFFANNNGYMTLRGCIASQCTGAGAVLNGPGLVEDCQFINTGLANATSRRSGVFASNRAVIRNNLIEGAPVGIETTGARAVVTGNTVGNASVAAYVLSANTLYGPIVNLSAVATAAVSGSTASGVLTTTDPNANFVH